MMTLYEQDLLSFRELTWLISSGDEEDESSGDEEDEPMVDDYFNLMAQFLMQMLAKTTPEKVIEFYDTYLRSPFSKMTKYIMQEDQEDLFDEIASSLNDCPHSDLIIALLENDMKK